MKRLILVLLLTLVVTAGAIHAQDAAQTQDAAQNDAAGQLVAIDLTLALSLLGSVASVVWWWVLREIRANEAAHREFRDDIKKVLSGDVAWLKALLDK